MAKLEPSREGEILKTTGIDSTLLLRASEAWKTLEAPKTTVRKRPVDKSFQAVYPSAILQTRVDETPGAVLMELSPLDSSPP